MKVDDKVREVIDVLLTDFQSPDSLDRIARHMIPPDDRPCHKWSLLNRLLVRVKRTDDARGMKQWNDLGRSVKGGSKAIYILLPNMRVKKDLNKVTGKEEKKQILVGFFRRPVFRLEDTHGKPVEYPDVSPPQPPPLLRVAKTWGCEVTYITLFGEGRSGDFNLKTGDIRLGTHDVKTFFHELVHAGQQKMSGHMKLGQDPKQEVIAEFGAAILLRIYGAEGEGNAYDYIARYTKAMKEADVARACMSVLSQTEKIIKKILNTELGEEDETPKEE